MPLNSNRPLPLIHLIVPGAQDVNFLVIYETWN